MNYQDIRSYVRSWQWRFAKQPSQNATNSRCGVWCRNYETQPKLATCILECISVRKPLPMGRLVNRNKKPNLNQRIDSRHEAACNILTTYWELINNVPSPKVINWPDRWLENSPFLQQLAILSVKGGGKSKSIYPIDIPLNFPEISLHIKWTSHEIHWKSRYVSHHKTHSSDKTVH